MHPKPRVLQLAFVMQRIQLDRANVGLNALSKGELHSKALNVLKRAHQLRKTEKQIKRIGVHFNDSHITGEDWREQA